MKTVLGLLFCFIALATLFLGFILIGLSLLSNNISEGSIEIILENIGKITHINGQLVVFIIGAVLVVFALGYTSKTLLQFAQISKPYIKNLKTFIRLFNPLL
jgi:hypothetical protein